ncbi:hypothetical protein BH20GEM1_BH20GEM1_21880 [soil metagenome]
MKPIFFLLSLTAVLLAGCSADSITGPADEARSLGPAENCSINTRLC